MSSQSRSYVEGDDKPGRVGEPLDAPDDPELTVAYSTLVEKRSHSGIVRGKSAKKALAQAVDNLDQSDAMRVLRPLARRGYIHIQEGIPPSGYVAVHVRPFSKRYVTETCGGEASAD